MRFDFLLFIFGIIILILIILTKQKFETLDHYPIHQEKLENRQQLCGMARVVEDNKIKYIHSGCHILRHGDYNEEMPGTSPWGDDGFSWNQEHTLL